MLADTDRFEKFRLALREVIQAFVATHRRAPKVLDFGCGTGALTQLALEEGACSVCAVDCNRDMLSISCKHLLKGGYVEGTHFELIEKLPVGEDGTPSKKFDILVSEIIGTLTTSECAHVYWADVEPFMNSFDVGRRWYTVPQKLEQKAAVYRIPDLFGGAKCRGGRKLMFEALFAHSCTGRDLSLFATNETCLPFHEWEPETIVDSVVVRTDTLGQSCKWIVSEEVECMHLPELKPNDHTFLALEWTVTLSDTVVLHNTFSEYRKLSPSVRAARAQSWGLMLAYLVPPDTTKLIGPLKLKFKTAQTGMMKISTLRVKEKRSPA